MRSFVATLLGAGAALCVAGQALAQAPTPAPAAPVPDQMPFDIPYGPAITADRAAQVVAAAVAEAKKSPRNWKLAISVVDPNGDLVYFYKMDQTQVASIGISQGKARTAARYRRPSGAFFNVTRPAPTYPPSIRRSSPPPAGSRSSRAASSSAQSVAAAPPGIRTGWRARPVPIRSNNRRRQLEMGPRTPMPRSLVFQSRAYPISGFFFRPSRIRMAPRT